jgi:hypothetical protein
MGLVMGVSKSNGGIAVAGLFIAIAGVVMCFGGGTMASQPRPPSGP